MYVSYPPRAGLTSVLRPLSSAVAYIYHWPLALKLAHIRASFSENTPPYYHAGPEMLRVSQAHNIMSLSRIVNSCGSSQGNRTL